MLEFLDRLHLDALRDLVSVSSTDPGAVWIKAGTESVNVRVYLSSRLKARLEVGVGDFSQAMDFNAEAFKHRCEDRLAVYLQRVVIDARKRGNGVYKDMNDLYDGERSGDRETPWVC